MLLHLAGIASGSFGAFGIGLDVFGEVFSHFLFLGWVEAENISPSIWLLPARGVFDRRKVALLKNCSVSRSFVKDCCVENRQKLLTYMLASYD